MDEEKLAKAINLITKARWENIRSYGIHNLTSAIAFRQALIISLEIDNVVARQGIAKEQLEIVDKEALEFAKSYLEKELNRDG